MQPETITVEVTPTAADISALKFDYFKRRWLEYLLILSPLILFFIYLYWGQQPLAVFLYERGMDGDMAETATIYGALPILVLLVLFARLLLNRIIRRESLVYHPCRYAVSAAGMSTDRDGMKANIEWRVVRAIRMTKKRTFVFIDPRTAYIFPQRAFHSEVDFFRFNELIRRQFDATHPTAS